MVRCVLFGSVVLGAVLLWIHAVWTGLQRQDDRCLAQAGRAVCVGIASVAGAWVAVLSYSAQISICPSVWIYLGLGLMLLLAVAVTEWLCRRCAERRTWKRRYLWFGLSLAASVLLAQPGRRFHGGETSAAVRQVAADVKTARDAVSRVHDLLTYAPAPFTDTASDTVERGVARCGGMANVLDKVLKAADIGSRIVHLEDDRRVHTLVEYFDRDTQQWILADPQYDILGGVGGGHSGWDVVYGGEAASVPDVWRGYARLYIYRLQGGYHRVTERNRWMYYAEKDGT